MGGEGSFSIQKIMLQILDRYEGFFGSFPKKKAREFSEGGSKAVCNFSENSSVLVT